MIVFRLVNRLDCVRRLLEMLDNDTLKSVVIAHELEGNALQMLGEREVRGDTANMIEHGPRHPSSERARVFSHPQPAPRLSRPRVLNYFLPT